MYLYIIYYHNGQEYDFDHLIAPDEINARRIFQDKMKDQDIYIESIQGAYQVNKSWDEQGNEYNISPTNSHK